MNRIDGGVPAGFVSVRQQNGFAEVTGLRHTTHDATAQRPSMLFSLR